MALDPQLLEILACPEDKGPLLYFADEDVALQPAAQAALRRPRRHPGHADRRGRDGRRRRARAAAGQGRGRRASRPTFEAVTVILDSLGMFDAAAALPEQLDRRRAGGDAALDGWRCRAHDDIANVVLSGHGRQRLAGVVVAARSAGPFMPVPVVVHNGYGIPNFVDDSHAGGRRLVLRRHRGDRRGGADGARRRRPPGVRHQAAGAWPSWPRRAGEVAPADRSTASRCRGPRSGALRRAAARWCSSGSGFFPGGTSLDRRRRRSSCTRRRDELIEPRTTWPAGSPAASGGRCRSSTAAAASGGVAAERWKTSSTRTPRCRRSPTQCPSSSTTRSAAGASTATSPARCFQLVLLRHDFEHPQVAAALRRCVDELLDEVVGGVHSVEAEGDGPLAQLLDLAAGRRLHEPRTPAAEQGVDPGPVPVARRASSRSGRGGLTAPLHSAPPG